ncbi:class I SAM-dependent methyltransferase [Extibacter muris]|uniref:class I SAM-dependent methyltransferase n=1 Tax=Extibacter muris TaxID=1796622 RepID=UPI001D08280A|nr:SAM-dependent methyltransferase [Extibacter muris]MCB6203291.1 SAM-dependent methyltransferase [Extibacter muris]MCQ4664887.1 SAM-dependent methyltransferase [Extibacter muris]MCQ4694801.1 SAM-dependent methyltransferase [Extibacter muris]
MEEIRRLLAENLNDMFIHAVLSNPRTREGWSKVKVRPVLIKGERMIQLEMFKGNQAFHQNVGMEEAGEVIAGQMESMKQMQLETTEALYTVLISKKGKVTVKRKIQKKEPISADISHNRKKQYILREGVPVPFLTDLGVMTEEGKVISSRFDKFRQINRFLEFIEDILPQLEREREVTILDFGCGKSYLTFAMYYYLHGLKGYDVRIIGLDLKSDVIRRCNELSEKYGYGKLRFLEGDIADYTGVEKVDMVVTLHACDTATDFALAKAVRWDAKVILSVPCCQHELNAQVKNEVLGPVMKYGLLKERFAALVTDGLRAQYLEREGYDTQILEFIDMEHTPKNILIRAVKTGRKGENQDTIDICEEFLHVSPALGRLLDEKGEL